MTDIDEAGEWKAHVDFPTKRTADWFGIDSSNPEDQWYQQASGSCERPPQSAFDSDVLSIALTNDTVDCSQSQPDGFGKVEDCLDGEPSSSRDAGQTVSSAAKGPSIDQATGLCSMADFDRQLFSAVWSGRSATAGLKMPWETGIMAQVFSARVPDPGFMNLHVLELARTPMPGIPFLSRVVVEAMHDGKNPAAVSSVAIRTERAFEVIAKKFCDVAWPNLLDAKRDRAMKRWQLILSSAPEAFGAAARIVKATDGTLDESDVARNITDIFANKSSSTLMKRAGALMMFLAWRRQENRSGVDFPVCESEAYEYISSMRGQTSAYTRAGSFISALRFAHFILQLNLVDDVLVSTRITGFVFKRNLDKPKVVQADPMTAQQVRGLENFMLGPGSDFDKAACGFFLFLVFARLRFTDGQHITSMSLDLDEEGIGFIEAGCDWTKTGNTARKRNLILPVAAPANGITKSSWAVVWFEVRSRVGLVCGTGLPLLPVLGTNERWLGRALEPDEGSKWLNELLIIIFGFKPLNRVRTHSCKDTTLSWCAKYGIQKHIRRTLGYHVAADDVSTFLYSRDAQSEPLRSLNLVLQDISSQAFEPDRSRSGRFNVNKHPNMNAESAPFNFVHPTPKRLAEKEASALTSERLQCRGCLAEMFHPSEICVCSVCKIVGCSSCLTLSERVVLGECESVCEKCIDQQSPASIHNSSSEDSSDSELSEVDLELDEQVAQIVSKTVTRKASPFCGSSCLQHKSSGTLHSQHLIKIAHLACGRIISASYRKLEGEQAFDWPRCSQCFGVSLKPPG